MPKTYRKIIRKCDVTLVYKNGETVDVVMDLDLNASIDDQIYNNFDESKLKKWWWFEKWWWLEREGPSMTELHEMLLGNEMDLRSQIPDNHIHTITEYLENSGGRISSDYDYFNCSSEMLEALDRYLA